MIKTRVICDSGSDLTVDDAKELNITRIPLFVVKDGVSYRDGEEITPQEMFKDMREGAIYTTSQISLDMFVDAFDEFARNGEDCLYIAFSSVLSGTYSTSLVAAGIVKEKYKDFNIKIIDTKCGSYGCGRVVDVIARMSQDGLSLDELYTECAKLSLVSDHIITVDDVQYLARGGRVSKVSALLAGALDIKPILEVKDGALNPIKKVRGNRKVLSQMLAYMKERIELSIENRIWIGHADDIDKALAFKEMVSEEFNTTNIFVGSLGAVIGAHTGPGSLAVFYTKKL